MDPADRCCLLLRRNPASLSHYGRVTVSSQRGPGRVVRDVLEEGTFKLSEFLALVSGSCLVG